MHYLCVTLTSKCHGLCRKCMSMGAHAVIWYVRYGCVGEWTVTIRCFYENIHVHDHPDVSRTSFH